MDAEFVNGPPAMSTAGVFSFTVICPIATCVRPSRYASTPPPPPHTLGPPPPAPPRHEHGRRLLVHGYLSHRNLRAPIEIRLHAAPPQTYLGPAVAAHRHLDGRQRLVNDHEVGSPFQRRALHEGTGDLHFA